MNRHYSQTFWHYGYENETELHVFVHGAIRQNADATETNVFGIFFGYADKRNSWGEFEGAASSERAEIAAMIRALALVQNDNRILHVHTTNIQLVDNLEQWMSSWIATKFQNDHDLGNNVNADLIQCLALLLKMRTQDVYFESIYQAAKVPGCALAISLALESTRQNTAQRKYTMIPDLASYSFTQRNRKPHFKTVGAKNDSFCANKGQEGNSLGAELQEFNVAPGVTVKRLESNARGKSSEATRRRGFAFSLDSPIEAAALLAN